MAANERMTRGGMFLRLVANNGQPVPAPGPAPVDVPSSRAGDGWYHEEAVQQEKSRGRQEPR